MNVSQENQDDESTVQSDDSDLTCRPPEQPLNLSPDSDTSDPFKEDPPENQDPDVTSETLPELPPYLLAKVPNGKRIYGACVRKQCQGVTTYLLDYDVWQIFCAEGNEMIITKKGRRMFPVPSFFICDLEPGKLYELSLELNAVNNRVYKYTNGKWVATKEGSYRYPTPVPGRDAYVHYHSPNTGDYWMREPVSFATLKISNNLDALGTIVLQSMRKYVMVLIVCDREAGSKIRIRLPETVFVAVTQYQNDNITKMKIEHNPFANAFRMSSGKSKEKDKEKSKRQLPVEETLHGRDSPWNRLPMEETPRDSDDEGETHEVSSTNQTPPRQPLPENMWAVGRPDLWRTNAFQISAFLEQRRQMLQNLLPPGSDRLNVTSPQQVQAGNNVVGWPHGFPQHALGQPLYPPPQLPEMSMDGRYMFPLQGFNPLAQVRQFGELNRCSDLEVPLSLVKKMKPQYNMIPSDCNNNPEPQNFRQSPMNIRPVPGNSQTEGSLSHRQMQLPAGHIPIDANMGLANVPSQYNRLVPDIGVMTQFSGERFPRTGSQVPGQNVSSHGRSTLPERGAVPTPLETAHNYPPSMPTYNSSWLAKPEVILRNRDLWATTHEVILSSSGRPMFPFVSLSVSKLHPARQYSISLKIVPCSNHLYEYRDHQWVPLLQVSEETRNAVYPHPDNPKNGCQWGPEVIFDKLRLSTLRQGKNMLKLQLRRQYLPHVVIETDTELWEFPLKDAIFITVKIDRSNYMMPETYSPDGQSASNENMVSQADRAQGDQTEDEEVPERNG